jgi:hypothetical protein
VAEIIPSTGAAGGPPPKKKRGRKRKIGTLVINVRIPIDVYDRYCIVAQRTRPGPISVRSVLRHIITLHAPSKDVQ